MRASRGARRRRLSACWPCWAVVIVALSISACGANTASEDRTTSSPIGVNLGSGAEFVFEEGDDGMYEVSALVLQNADQGPMICTSEVADSAPPICGDVELSNWDWDKVEGEDRSGRGIWGTFHFFGRMENGSFTVDWPDS